MQKETVLVTGGTGFIAQYCMIALLEAGYHVRTTVRSLSREGEVRAYLKTGGVDAGPNLSFVQADLTRDAGWADACAGCAFVMHGASPTPCRKGSRGIISHAMESGSNFPQSTRLPCLARHLARIFPIPSA